MTNQIKKDMEIKLKKERKMNTTIQFVWWGFDEGWHRRWGIWKYPKTYKEEAMFNLTPIFIGYCFGIFEIRYFPKRSLK